MQIRSTPYLRHLLSRLVIGIATVTAPAVKAQPEIRSQPERAVKNNILHSSALPQIKVQVAAPFRYLGKFDFVLKNIAYGERHIFVDDHDGKVRRLFIFQFEGFLPNNEHTYNYNFANAEDIGGFKFRQNTWAYSNRNALENSPGGEGALTAQFIRSKGLQLEDELMMSRFLMVPDSARRHEMILFYLENASTTGHGIDTFYDDRDSPTPHWRQNSVGLTARSRESFRIIH